MEKKATVEVKFKDLRVAVVALNEAMLGDKKLLEANDLKTIKMVGVTKEAILKDFMDAMDKIEDVDEKFPGPKESLEFYNTMLDAEEKAVAEANAQPADTGKKNGGKKSEKPAGGKKGKTNGEAKEDKGPGVIATILDIIKTKGPITKEKIIEKLAEKIPGKDKDRMAKTVQAQLGGKQPTRMEKEKKVKFVVTDKGFALK